MVVGHRPSETSPVSSSTFTTSRSPYAGGFFTAALPGSSPLPWPSLRMTSSAPSFSRYRANISTLQDLLYATGCCFAPLSQGVTTLRHSQLPGCTGCLLRGLLIVTTTGLAPVSRRCLSGHTMPLLGGTGISRHDFHVWSRVSSSDVLIDEDWVSVRVHDDKTGRSRCTLVRLTL